MKLVVQSARVVQNLIPCLMSELGQSFKLRSIALVLPVFLLFQFVPSVQADPPDLWGKYPNCKAPALPIEVHSWWKEPSEVFPRHVHTAACLPNARDENGPIIPSEDSTIWIRSMTYNQPGRVNFVRMGWSNGSKKRLSGDPRNTSICDPHPVTGLESCRWQDSFILTPDGMRANEDELRINTDIRHEDLGTRQFPTLNFQLRKAAGGSHYRRDPDIIARSWYTDHDYARVTVNYQDLVPKNKTIPTVSGTVSLKVKHTGGEHSRTSVAWENVDFHACPDLWEQDVAPGKVISQCGPAKKLYEVSGLWKGTLKWNTTKLKNGLNFLYIQTQDQKNDGGMNAAAVKLLFNVQNGSSEDPDTPPEDPDTPPEDPDTPNNFVVATDDARVSASRPTRNYGGSDFIRTRSGLWESYLKFNINIGLTGQPTSATLRLFVTNGSPDGGDVFVVGNAWDESTVTWDTAPGLTSSPITSVGSVTEGEWVEINVTSAINGDGLYSFGMGSASSNSAFYSTKESANPPELVIEP